MKPSKLKHGKTWEKFPTSADPPPPTCGGWVGNLGALYQSWKFCNLKEFLCFSKWSPIQVVMQHYFHFEEVNQAIKAWS